MPLYTIINDKLHECKWDCDKDHPHIRSSYEVAMKYFGVEEQEIKSYGDVFNILYYLQTDRNTTRRLTNELFNRLVRVQSEPKYFAPYDKREEIAINALNKGYKFNLIMDDIIVKRLKRSERQADKSRLYFYNLVMESKKLQDMGLEY